MKRIVQTIVFMVVMVFSINELASAQGFPRCDMDGMGRMGMHQKNLENLRLLKLLETLDLSEDQNDLFISAFSRFRKDSRTIMRKLENEVDSLAEYLRQDDRNDDVIMKKIGIIEESKEGLEKARKDFLGSIKNILTVEQLGKMIVFQERFERELLEKIRGFRAPGSQMPMEPGPGSMMPNVPSND